MHTDSDYRAASFIYGLADSTLMMAQRLLLCVLVCLGCDIYMPRARMDSSRGFTLTSMVIRITRNFYFILRGLRKWLAINFNDSIIPVPAVQPIRRVRAHGSTPRRDAAPHDYLAEKARLHSPVRPCYIGSDVPISLFRMLAGAAPIKLNLNHPDLLSISFYMIDIMSSLVEVFTGCLVDPDVATEEVDENGEYNDELELKSFNCSNSDEFEEFQTDVKVNASFIYGFADSTLMMAQRLLLCVLVCLGCDIYMPRARMDSSREFTLTSMVIRITRNFYFILRGLRKWLAINFNDGIIPVPAVQPVRRVRAHRSTPRRDAVPHDYLAEKAPLVMPSLNGKEVEMLIRLKQYMDNTTEHIQNNHFALRGIIETMNAVSEKAREMLTTYRSREAMRSKSLDVCLYNVNPVKDLLPTVCDLVDREKPCFLILINTGAKTLNTTTIDPTRKHFGYRHFVGDFAADGRSRGIMFLTSQDTVQTVGTDWSGRGRLAVFLMERTGLVFVIFDASTTPTFGDEERNAFIEYTAEVAETHLRKGHRVVIAGNSEIYASDYDVHDGYEGRGMGLEERNALNRLHDAGFEDTYRTYNPLGRDFSYWYHEPRTAGIGSRRDVIFADQRILERVIEVRYLPEFIGNRSAPVLMSFRP